MTYQDLLDVLMAQPGATPLAAQAPGVQALAAGALGRRREPEIGGVPNGLTRPNDERAMSGEIHRGIVADGGNAQFHAYDPIVPPALTSIFGIPAPRPLTSAPGPIRRAEAHPARNLAAPRAATVHFALLPLPKSDLGRV